jgi:hypothetical protein
MLVYVGFALALVAANTGSDAESSTADVSPGSTPVELFATPTLFRPMAAEAPRNDF